MPQPFLHIVILESPLTLTVLNWLTKLCQHHAGLIGQPAQFSTAVHRRRSKCCRPPRPSAQNERNAACPEISPPKDAIFSAS